MDFLAGPAWTNWRILAVLGVATVVPLVAFLYGSATGLILKLLKFG
jgi:EamA domain-containing membrane protein RarD